MEIQWGDGTLSAGQVYYDSLNERDNVCGTHTYAAEASYQITATVTEVGGATADDSGSPSTITVYDSPLDAWGFCFPVTTGSDTYDGPVARFVDEGGPESPENYSATITWAGEEGLPQMDGVVPNGASWAVGPTRATAGYRLAPARRAAAEATYSNSC